MILRKTQVLRRAQHAVRLDAADLSLLDFHAEEPRPHHRYRRFHSGNDVWSSTDDRKRRTAADVDLTERKPVGVGVFCGLEDLPDDDTVEGGRHRFDRLDVEPAHGQHAYELLRRHFRIDEGAQPAFWKFHVNWARKRRSPS